MSKDDRDKKKLLVMLVSTITVVSAFTFFMYKYNTQLLFDSLHITGPIMPVTNIALDMLL